MHVAGDGFLFRTNAWELFRDEHQNKRKRIEDENENDWLLHFKFYLEWVHSNYPDNGLMLVNDLSGKRFEILTL